MEEVAETCSLFDDDSQCVHDHASQDMNFDPKPKKIDRYLTTGTADLAFLTVVKKLKSMIRSIDDYDSFLEDNIDVSS